MKKVVALLLALIMTMSLVACGGSKEEAPAPAPAAPAAPAPAAPAAPEKEESSEPEYILKIANPSNPEDNVVKAFYRFEELVEERSNGRIDVQVYDSGQLGAHADYIDSMQMHSLQAGEVNTSVLGNLDPAFSIFDLPYLTDGMDSLIEIVNGELGEVLDQRLQDVAGLKLLAWMVRSPRSVYTNQGPVSSLADMKGTKIRIMESALMSRSMELLGMVPVPLAATERYMALQTGTVDAAENSLGIIISQAEYEVTKYVVMSDHFCTPNVIAMDAEFYNSLPADLQTVLDECGAEAGDYCVELEKQSEQESLDRLENEFGMTICYIEDKTEFLEAVAPIYEEYRDKIGQDIYDYFGK